jgi:hypothetical protein
MARASALAIGYVWGVSTLPRGAMTHTDKILREHNLLLVTGERPQLVDAESGAPASIARVKKYLDAARGGFPGGTILAHLEAACSATF